MRQLERQIHFWAHMLDEAFEKKCFTESQQRLEFLHDVPEEDFKQMMSKARISNKHFNMEQFEKLYGADYTWSILLDNGECVAAAVLLEDFGPIDGMTYVNKLQSLVSGGGYGKKMLLALQDFYDKLWLMADASVKSDVLLQFYRDPQFNFIEHILPAEESKYGVDTHVFTHNIVDERTWHKFLKRYFGNEEAVASLTESVAQSKDNLNALIDEVMKSYLGKFGIDLSYMNFKVSAQPVYTNGEPCYEYDEDECAGDWTSLGWIRLNPDMKSVIKRYGLDWHSAEDIEDFTKRIIAHELAHEVWHNVADNSFKDYVLDKARRSSFTTAYLKTVRPSKLDEETFCEWMSNKINEEDEESGIKKMTFPLEEIQNLKDNNHIVTHRVLDDFNKFNEGDKVRAPWDTLYEVTQKTVIDDIDYSPYISQLTQEQRDFLKKFDKIAVLELDALYEPPYNLQQIKAKYPEKVFQKLSRDPVHRWRAETGIELIHHEPDEEEQDRTWKNWQLMPQKLKDISDKKSLEMFDCTNAEHYKQLKRQQSLDDSIKQVKVWRFTYLGIGIYEAVKQKIFKSFCFDDAQHRWRDIIDSSKWLPKPRFSYGSSCESWFTDAGKQMFEKKTLPLMLQYINENNVKLQSKFIPTDIIMSEDKFQIFVKNIEKDLNENKQAYLKKYSDEEDVIPVVDMFQAIKQRLKAPQNDIDWWIKKPFQALKDFVQSYDLSNKRQRRDIEYRREMTDNDARMLGSRDGYEIWYVPTYEAMRTIGRFYKGVSTQWCVSSDDPSFWFDMHDQSEFIVLVRENLQHDEFDKLAIEMQNGGRAFDEDEFLVWDVENEDDRACIDDLMHYAWELFIDNGERRKGL